MFRRSFSVLILVLIVHRDNQHAFLSETAWNELITGVETYCRTEADHRGLVPSKGWAHAIAHTSDLIDEIAESPRVTVDQLGRLHDALVLFVGRTTSVFDSAEEGRIGRALSGLLRRVGTERHRALVLRHAEPLHTASATNLRRVVRSTSSHADRADRPALEALEAELTETN